MSTGARPQVADQDLYRRIAGLSAAKLEILSRRLRQKGFGRSKAHAIQRRQQFSPVPLSLAQQRLWFVDQIEPGSSVYNIPAAVRVIGKLKAQELERSINAIVARHESLRTTFDAIEGDGVQVIHPIVKLPLPLIDLQEVSESSRQTIVRQLADLDAQQGFDLKQAPLLRVKLIRLAPEDHIMLLTMHHIVSDAWSMGVLVKEIGLLYESPPNTERSLFPEMTIQYPDYAVWQREWLSGKTLDAQIAYWRRQLEAAPRLALPTDRPRLKFQTFKGATRRFALTGPLSDAIKELNQREGVTPFMTLLAAFAILLQRYTGQDDLVIGSNTANRDRSETEAMIGFFVNNVVLRLDLSGDPTFRSLLGRVREVALDAYAHQDLPFDKLVGELQPQRDPAYSPFFQVMFVFQNVPFTPLEISGLKLVPFEIENKSSKFDLTFFMWEYGEGFAGSVEYNTDLFEDSTILKMQDQFQALLRYVVADPSSLISNYSLMTEEQAQGLLTDFMDPLDEMT